jgi:hypothetical protein
MSLAVLRATPCRRSRQGPRWSGIAFQYCFWPSESGLSKFQVPECLFGQILMLHQFCRTARNAVAMTIDGGIIPQPEIRDKSRLPEKVCPNSILATGAALEAR